MTLVGNDTGGAICQLVVTGHPERVGRLVLTPCDAYEHFLPPAFRYLQVLARIPGGVGAVAQSMRIPAVRRTPLAFGWLSKTPDPGRGARATGPSRSSATAPCARDAREVLRGISKRYTLEAATRLREFEGPTMLAWATEDRFFKPRFAERLAADIPGSRLEWIPEDARTFVSEDQPRRLAELIGEFATTCEALSPRVGRSPHGGVASSTVPPASTRRTPAMLVADPLLRDRDLDLDRAGLARDHRRRAERGEHVVHLVVAGEQQRREPLDPLLAGALGEQRRERRSEPAARATRRSP